MDGGELCWPVYVHVDGKQNLVDFVTGFDEFAGGW